MLRPVSAGEERWLGLPPRIAMGFVAALVCLLAAALLSFASLRVRDERARLVEHTGSTRLALEELETSLLISDTALRGYVATGGTWERTRYLEAHSRISAALARLAAQLADEPELQARLDRLSPVVQLAEREQVRLFARAVRGDRAGAQELSRTGAATQAVTEAEDLVDEMEHVQEGLIDGRQIALDRAATVAKVLFVGVEVVLLALTLVAARTVRDEIRTRERHAEDRAHALELQRRLMAIVSHDLRNPLSGILGAAALLVRSELPPRDAHLARRIGTTARRMERLIRDLLDFSRVQAGAGIPIAARPTDLAEVCRTVVQDLGDAGARVRIEATGSASGVWDPDRLEQVVANLVSNALKYGPPDGAVQVRVAGDEEAVRLEVRDEGPGIAPDAQATIFQPFRRGRSRDANAPASLGLGLFIVRILAEAHGGSVALEPSPRGGATFAVRLPRDGVAEGAPDGGQAPGSPLQQPSAG